jgi:hypothetical protein
VATEQAPVIIPVNFSLWDRRVLVRVGAGFLTQAAAGQLVAFEVDHVDPAAGTAWSVLVRGLAVLVDTPTKDQIMAAEPLVPEPGNEVLLVRPDVLTGRRFTLRPAS